LLFHPNFSDHGGGEMVAAWTLQVLQETHDTLLWCENKPDFARMDARFSTCLAEQPVRVLRPPWWWRWMLRAWPGRGRLLRLSLIVRCFHSVDRRWSPRIWISTYNEMWLPHRGLQYIHWPEKKRVTAVPTQWSAMRRMAYQAAQWLSGRIGVHQAKGPEYHRTLANSRWTLGKLPDRYRDATVLYPPVPAFAPGRPWAEREDRVVCLGRWSELKRLELVIEVVEQARRAGASDLKLAFAGFWDAAPDYQQKIMNRTTGLDWIEWHERLDRDSLQDLVGASRYGLHAMNDEHFGIAVAEMMTAGCVVLVHASGGPPEIVQDRRQCYMDAAEGGRALHAIWSAPVWQLELHAAARPLGLRFSPERFCAALRKELTSLAG
jgi:glycosyltransferase involved in cell wall biosynthesis